MAPEWAGYVKAADRFLAGPIPWWWIAIAARLPGKALHVGIALWRLKGAVKSDTVKLGNTELEPLGVSRSAKARALESLEESGLIEISQEPGKLPRVTILRTRPRS